MSSERSRSGGCVVVVRDHPAFPAPNRVAVLSPAFEPGRIVRGPALPGETLHPIVPEPLFRDDPSAWARHAGALTVVAETDSAPGRFLAMTRSFPAAGFEYLVAPESAGDGTTAILAASLGFPVRLTGAAGWTEEVLDALLGHFLYSPALAVPVEPFYTLAEAIAGGREASLHDVFDEVPGRNAYVDAERRVSLSERWAARDRFFGAADDDPASFRDSDLWAETAGARHRMLARQEPCSFCPHFRWCAGWWTTVGDEGEACRRWRAAMDRLAGALGAAGSGG